METTGNDPPAEIVAPPLEYAARPPWHRRGRGILVIVSVALLIAIGGGFFAYRKFRPAIDERLRLRTFHQTCLAYSTPATKVVYQEASLLMSLRKSTQPATAVTPPPTDMLMMASNNDSWSWLSPLFLRKQDLMGNPATQPLSGIAILFLHERSNASGKQRLVCVEITQSRLKAPVQFPNAATVGRYIFRTTVVQPATYLSPPKLLSERLEQSIEGWPWPPFGLTVFGGEPDPKDPSRFTISFQSACTTRTIDGQLMPDDSVKLEVRKQ